MEIGESLVGAFLKFFESCDIVEYNLILPRQIDSQGEIDVVGINFKDQKIFLCEVVTHLQTMNYGSREETVNKIRQKMEKNRKLAEMQFADWEAIYMVWSPTVGQLMDDGLNAMLNELKGIKVDLIFNEEYANRVIKLIEKASHDIKDYNEPFFRCLQILTHLKMTNQAKLFNSLIYNAQRQHITKISVNKNPPGNNDHSPRHHYEAAEILLRELGKSIHIEKLTQLLKEKYPDLFYASYNSHNLQSTISKYLNIFKRYGNGNIGLQEWG